MIIDPVGSKYIVTGSRIARVEAGPKPGNTLTSVPKRAPSKQYNKFIGENAFRRPFIKSIYDCSRPFPTP